LKRKDGGGGLKKKTTAHFDSWGVGEPRAWALSRKGLRAKRSMPIHKKPHYTKERKFRIEDEDTELGVAYRGRGGFRYRAQIYSGRKKKGFNHPKE